MNMNTDPIRSLGDSDFSDHIGVSTLLYTKDGYIFVFRQAGNAGYNANYYMPTGSGSMDYADFKEGEDLRQMIIRGAERELGGGVIAEEIARGRGVCHYSAYNGDWLLSRYGKGWET